MAVSPRIKKNRNCWWCSHGGRPPWPNGKRGPIALLQAHAPLQRQIMTCCEGSHCSLGEDQRAALQAARLRRRGLKTLYDTTAHRAEFKLAAVSNATALSKHVTNL